MDGAVLGEAALVLRWFGDAGKDRLLLVNLGTDLSLEVMPEPLLAPPAGAGWTLAWSSEYARYGGGGAAAIPVHGCWTLAGHAAVVLRPERMAE